MDYQQTLEARGVPSFLAEKCAVILEKQNQDPFYERTEEDQETIDISYQILIGKIKYSGGNNEQ
jgi:hypothetical protein